MSKFIVIHILLCNIAIFICIQDQDFSYAVLVDTFLEMNVYTHVWESLAREYESVMIYLTS